MTLIFLILFHIFSIVLGNNSCGFSTNLEEYQQIFNQTSSSPNLRIIGGHESKNGDWPWLVSIHKSPGTGTGTLIHPRWVLTAAHNDVHPGNLVKYGHVNYEKAKIAVVEESWEPDCGVKIVNCDIALLKLREPVEFNDQIHAICLKSNIPKNPGVQNAIAGYGIEPITNKPRVTAWENSVTIQNHNHCFNRSGDREICAGDENHGVTVGDSGGPIMAIVENKWVQHGVTSRNSNSNPKKSEYLPGHDIYSDVTSWCDWIEKITKNEVKCQ